MRRGFPALWAGPIIYAVGIAILVPVTLFVAGESDGNQLGKSRGATNAFSNGAVPIFMVAGFVSGGSAYLLSSRYSTFLLRWAATVVATVGTTIALLSLPFVAFYLFGALLAFATGAVTAGIEAFLFTGLWTAVVLAGERALGLSSAGGHVAFGGTGPARIELAMRLFGCAALCLSLGGVGRLARGLMNLPARLDHWLF